MVDSKKAYYQTNDPDDWNRKIRDYSEYIGMVRELLFYNGSGEYMTNESLDIILDCALKAINNYQDRLKGFDVLTFIAASNIFTDTQAIRVILTLKKRGLTEVNHTFVMLASNKTIGVEPLLLIVEKMKEEAQKTSQPPFMITMAKKILAMVYYHPNYISKIAEEIGEDYKDLPNEWILELLGIQIDFSESELIKHVLRTSEKLNSYHYSYHYTYDTKSFLISNLYFDSALIQSAGENY